jgi:hypothetical protein
MGGLEGGLRYITRMGTTMARSSLLFSLRQSTTMTSRRSVLCNTLCSSQSGTLTQERGNYQMQRTGQVLLILLIH